MDKDFHERERLRLQEEREYEERWRREQQEREDRHHREEMAVLHDLTSILRQMAQNQQTPAAPPQPSPSVNNTWSQERLRLLEEREFVERLRREEQERENRQRREEMAVLQDLTSTLRQMTQAQQMPAMPPTHPHSANNPWSEEQLQLLQE